MDNRVTSYSIIQIDLAIFLDCYSRIIITARSASSSKALDLDPLHSSIYGFETNYVYDPYTVDVDQNVQN